MSSSEEEEQDGSYFDPDEDSDEGGYEFAAEEDSDDDDYGFALTCIDDKPSSRQVRALKHVSQSDSASVGPNACDPPRRLCCAQPVFTVLSEKDIARKQEEAVGNVTGMLALSDWEASALLRTRKWCDPPCDPGERGPAQRPRPWDLPRLGIDTAIAIESALGDLGFPPPRTCRDANRVFDEWFADENKFRAEVCSLPGRASGLTLKIEENGAWFLPRGP